MFKDLVQIATFKKSIDSFAKNTSIISGLKDLAIIGIIFGIISGLLGILGVADLVLGIISLIVGIIIMPIFLVIGSIIGSVILFVFAKIFGGKGTFSLYAGALAKISAAMLLTYMIPLLIIQSLLTLVVTMSMGLESVSLLAIISMIFGLLTLIVSLISIYFEVKATQIVHNLSFIKSLLVVLLPVIIIIILAILSVMYLMVGLVSTMPVY